MKAREAFDEFCDLNGIKYSQHKKEIDPIRTALTELERLQERDTAKKVVFVKGFSRCPVCNNWVGFNHRLKHCDNCGQRLDWSE